MRGVQSRLFSLADAAAASLGEGLADGIRPPPAMIAGWRTAKHTRSRWPSSGGSIRRRAAEATAWMQAGTDLATTFDGFLGSGWVRAGENSDLWFMLYRFRDIPTLEAWEDSGERTWWLESGSGFAKEGRVERRTGIEGWFDAPLATNVETRMPEARRRGRPIRHRPPCRRPVRSRGRSPRRRPAGSRRSRSGWGSSRRTCWRCGCSASCPASRTCPLVARVLLTTVLLTPVMTYAVLPVGHTPAATVAAKVTLTG